MFILKMANYMPNVFYNQKLDKKVSACIFSYLT